VAPPLANAAGTVYPECRVIVANADVVMERRASRRCRENIDDDDDDDDNVVVVVVRIPPIGPKIILLLSLSSSQS
jgi:hypothetical protein